MHARLKTETRKYPRVVIFAKLGLHSSDFVERIPTWNAYFVVNNPRSVSDLTFHFAFPALNRSGIDRNIDTIEELLKTFNVRITNGASRRSNRGKSRASLSFFPSYFRTIALFSAAFVMNTELASTNRRF